MTHANDCIQNEDSKNYDGIDEGGPALLLFEQSQDEGDCRGGEEDDDQLVLELLEYKLP